jgi:hypothetical protein
MTLQTIIMAVAAGWLLALTIAFIVILRFFNRLVKGAKDASLKGALDKILDQEGETRKRLDSLEKETTKLEEEGLLHIQKMGLVRFNPFKEIGGDHSFSLALLDGKDTGVIVTGLHTRERTRVYMKPIKGGKCEYELSDEEKKALAKAQKS